MTDYSSWTDEQVNEAIFKAKGWVEVIPNILWTRGSDRVDIENTREIPDYTHSWELCGELLEEMKSDYPGVFYMDEHSNSKFWRAQVNILWRDADTPQRAICEAWLAWKEQG